MAMRVALGQNVFVERRLGRKTFKATSKVIGIKPPRHLLLDPPYHQSGPLLTTADEKCIIRYLSDGVLVGFWAQVAKITHDPFPMLIVEYPEQFEEVTVRQWERLACNIPATVAFDDSAVDNDALENALGSDGAANLQFDPPITPTEPLYSVVLDLSEGGLRAAVPLLDAEDPSPEVQAIMKEIDEDQHIDYHSDAIVACCKVGTTVALGMRLPPPASGADLSVTSEIRWSQNRNDHHCLGLKFLEPDPEVVEDVRAIIEFHNQYFIRRFSEE